jgi:hypothetical protein
MSPSFYTQRKAWRRLLSARVLRNPRVTSNSTKWMGNLNPFVGSVDVAIGLLLRIPKCLQVLVAREGYLRILSLTLVDEREWKRQPLLEVQEGYI